MATIESVENVLYWAIDSKDVLGEHKPCKLCAFRDACMKNDAKMKCTPQKRNDGRSVFFVPFHREPSPVVLKESPKAIEDVRDGRRYKLVEVMGMKVWETKRKTGEGCEDCVFYNSTSCQGMRCSKDGEERIYVWERPKPVLI